MCEGGPGPPTINEMLYKEQQQGLGEAGSAGLRQGLQGQIAGRWATPAGCMVAVNGFQAQAGEWAQQWPDWCNACCVAGKNLKVRRLGVAAAGGGARWGWCCQGAMRGSEGVRQAQVRSGCVKGRRWIMTLIQTTGRRWEGEKEAAWHCAPLQGRRRAQPAATAGPHVAASRPTSTPARPPWRCCAP